MILKLFAHQYGIGIKQSEYTLNQEDSEQNALMMYTGLISALNTDEVEPRDFSRIQYIETKK